MDGGKTIGGRRELKSEGGNGREGGIGLIRISGRDVTVRYHILCTYVYVCIFVTFSFRSLFICIYIHTYYVLSNSFYVGNSPSLIVRLLSNTIQQQYHLHKHSNIHVFIRRRTRLYEYCRRNSYRYTLPTPAGCILCTQNTNTLHPLNTRYDVHLRIPVVNRCCRIGSRSTKKKIRFFWKLNF